MAAEEPKPKPQPPTPDYVPRLYQTELVDMAKEKNVVAYLDTGAGKTFIAVLLLRHRIDAFRLATATTATPRTRKNCDDAGNDPYPSAAPATSSLPATKPSFLAVFLAPRVSLVQQQAEVLARHLPAKVKSFIGETTEHWWTDPMAGRAELTAIEVAVMTPQVLVNTLNHAVLRNICAIDTIVLDEAHHCRKKDPTNVAMEFYRRASRDPRRPLVLGLTAAPAMASQRSKNVLKSLRELETNLDATVVTVRDRAELEEIVPPVSIVVERYPADEPPTAVKDLENALESTAERLDAVIAEAHNAWRAGIEHWVGWKNAEDAISVSFEPGAPRFKATRLKDVLRSVACVLRDIGVFGAATSMLAAIKWLRAGAPDPRNIYAGGYSRFSAGEYYVGGNHQPQMAGDVGGDGYGGVDGRRSSEAMGKAAVQAAAVGDAVSVALFDVLTAFAAVLGVESFDAPTVVANDAALAQNGSSSSSFTSADRHGRRPEDDDVRVSGSDATCDARAAAAMAVRDALVRAEVALKRGLPMRRTPISAMQAVVDMLKLSNLMPDGNKTTAHGTPSPLSLASDGAHGPPATPSPPTLSACQDAPALSFLDAEVPPFVLPGPPPAAPPLPQMPALLASKSLALIQVLMRYQGESKTQRRSWSCIVFVKQRLAALAVCNLLGTLPCLKDWLRPSAFMASGASFGDVAFTADMQKDILARFKSGALNLLVSTSVAEEGIDVRSCSLVVRFDPAPTAQAFHQSRGRARVAGSHMVALVQIGDQVAEQALEQYAKYSLTLREAVLQGNENDGQADGAAQEDDDGSDYYDDDDYEGRAKERQSGCGTPMQTDNANNDNNADKMNKTNSDGVTAADGDVRCELKRNKATLEDDEEDPISDADAPYVVESTGARVSLHSCLPLLMAYTSTLPGDRFTQHRPAYRIDRLSDGTVRALVRLPSCSAVESAVGQPARNKRRAKASAALQACRELHRAAALNDHLLPSKWSAEDSDSDQEDIGVMDEEDGWNAGAGTGGHGLQQSAARASRGLKAVHIRSDPPMALSIPFPLLSKNACVADHHTATTAAAAPASRTSVQTKIYCYRWSAVPSLGLCLPQAVDASAASFSENNVDCSAHSLTGTGADTPAGLIFHREMTVSADELDVLLQCSAVLRELAGAWCCLFKDAPVTYLITPLVAARDGGIPIGQGSTPSQHRVARVLEGLDLGSSEMNDVSAKGGIDWPVVRRVVSLQRVTADAEADKEGGGRPRVTALDVLRGNAASKDPALGSVRLEDSVFVTTYNGWRYGYIDVSKDIRLESPFVMDTSKPSYFKQRAAGKTGDHSCPASEGQEARPPTTYAEYYAQRWKIDNLDRSQPLLVAERTSMSLLKRRTDVHANQAPGTAPQEASLFDGGGSRRHVSEPTKAGDQTKSNAVPSRKRKEPEKDERQLQMMEKELEEGEILDDADAGGADCEDAQRRVNASQENRPTFGAITTDDIQQGGDVARHATSTSTSSSAQQPLFLVPELCVIHPVPLPLWAAVGALPRLMWHCEGALHAQELLSSLHTRGLYPAECPPVSLITQALTSASTLSSQNYETLETAGDTFLKYCVCVNLFLSRPKWHEGQLTATKDRLVSNRRLVKAALELGLDVRVRVTPFATGADGKKGRKQVWRASKLLADVVEALIGAFLRGVGPEAALRFLQHINLVGDAVWSEQLPLYAQPPDAGWVPRFSIEHVERALGYRFRAPWLVQQALTHGSVLGCPSYQRLEFLGDAVLDMALVTQFLKEHPDAEPSMIHDMRSCCGNFERLALVAVRHGIHRFLVHGNPALFRHVDELVTAAEAVLVRIKEEFREEHRAKRRRAAHNESGSRGRRQVAATMVMNDADAWDEIMRRHAFGLRACTAPKVLCDVIEALIGAVWLDTAGDLDVSWRVVVRLLSPIPGMGGEPVVLNPVRLLHELAARRGCAVAFEPSEGNEHEDEVRMRVYIGEELMGEGSAGRNKAEAERLAAQAAMAALMEREKREKNCRI